MVTNVQAKRVLCAAVLLTGVLGTGCSAIPKVTYQEVTGPDASGTIKFVLSRSLIVLDRRSNKDEGVKLVAVAVPTDLPAVGRQRLYAIVPSNQVGVKTQLKVTYADNSRLIASVGVEVEDHRAKTIGEIAGAIVAGIALVSAMAVQEVDLPERLPVVIDPKAYESAALERAWLPLPQNRDWVYRLTVEPPPTDAVEPARFFDGKPTSVLPYSACRDATLYVLAAKDKKTDEQYEKRLGEAWVFGLKLADSERLLTVGLPAKGKVDMHTGCGANVTSEKTETASAWALLSEVIKQATAIKKAYDEIEKKAGE